MATHTVRTMGTMASLIFADQLPSRTVLAGVEALFAEDEHRFSLYREGSEISRLRRREIVLSTASSAFRSAYELAAEWRLLTHGAFTPERPDGVLDLSGIVKALSIQRARDGLQRAGINNAVIDIGGDAVAIGSYHGDRWRAGIIHPEHRSTLLCSVPLDRERPAIATSGSAERGEHIWLSRSSEFAQVTVLAHNIITADVLATAIIAGGRDSRDDFTERWDIDVLTVDSCGNVEMTPGMLARSQPVGTAAS